MDAFPRGLIARDRDGCSPRAGRSRTRRRWPWWAARWPTPGSLQGPTPDELGAAGGVDAAPPDPPGTPSRCSAGPRSSTGRRSAGTGTASSPARWAWGCGAAGPARCRPRSTSTPKSSVPAAGLDADTRRVLRRGGGRPAGVVPVPGCNPRHHSLALRRWPAPAGIVHLMIQAASLDDVGRALDRFARRRQAGVRDHGEARQRLMVRSTCAPRVGSTSRRHRRPAGRRRDLDQPGEHCLSLWGHTFAGLPRRGPARCGHASRA